MVTIQQVRTCDPTSWGDLGEALHKLAGDMDEAADSLYKRGAGELDEHWTDPMGAQAAEEFRSLASSYEIVGIQLRGVRSIISSLELTLGVCQREIDTWMGVCEQEGLTVDAEGHVTVPQVLRGDPALAQTAGAAESALIAALNEAREVDDTAARALRAHDLHHLDANGDGGVDERDLDEQRDGTLNDANDAAVREIVDGMPLDASAAEQEEWWNGLTPEEQEQYRNAAPLELADMDGIPDDVKDQINGGPQGLGYDRIKMLEYARDNWENHDIDVMANNCTNFVSLALEHAGMDSKGYLTLQEDAWGHRLYPDLPVIGLKGGYTDTWGGADANHDFFVENGSPQVSRDEVQPGDVVYWAYADDGDGHEVGEEHHAAVVTRVLPNGDVLYTQHTDSARDQSLDGRLPHNEVVEGDQNVSFVRPTQTW